MDLCVSLHWPFLACLLVLSVQAQTERDKDMTVFFRFVSDRDMFYREGNEAALDSLFRLLDHASLATGSVKVDGYSRTKTLSRTRCNRVKSELITRCRLREAHFTTQSLTGTCRTSHDNTFSIHANLLRWATLTPDLGIEWGILVNSSWTSWSWDDKNRRYALWDVAPGVRHYIG